ncbi:ankyrin repeat protein [Wolbachia endosymbiont of Cylisticus convexus]|nr:ankyrin repeat protein [Wolbachia endosymbiont of Cylisticus convexus]
MYNYLNLVEKLIEKGAKIKAGNNDQKTPLDLADKVEIKKLLVEKLAELDGVTPLHYATEYSSLNVVKLFASEDVNARAENPVYNEVTPLHLAAKKGKADIAEFLVSKGAEVNAADIRNWTPLHYAANENKLEVAQLLVSKGADVNAKNKRGWTPLHVAAEKGNLNVTELLVGSNGTQIDAVSNTKSTPLHLAAEAGKLEVVELLVGKEANVNAVNKNRKTPLDLACKKNQTAVVNFLSALGHTRCEVHIIDSSAQMTARDLIGYKVHGHPEIQHSSGQNGGVVLPEVNSTVVDNATMLLELIARKLTGKKTHLL